MKNHIKTAMFIFASSFFIACWGTNNSDCCKICKKGKACGDVCISKRDECKQAKGCACDE